MFIAATPESVCSLYDNSRLSTLLKCTVSDLLSNTKLSDLCDKSNAFTQAAIKQAGIPIPTGYVADPTMIETTSLRVIFKLHQGAGQLNEAVIAMKKEYDDYMKLVIGKKITLGDEISEVTTASMNALVIDSTASVSSTGARSRLFTTDSMEWFV